MVLCWRNWQMLWNQKRTTYEECEILFGEVSTSLGLRITLLTFKIPKWLIRVLQFSYTQDRDTRIMAHRFDKSCRQQFKTAPWSILPYSSEKERLVFWHLRPWQTKTHSCRHKCFPFCPREQHLLRFCVRDTKNVSDFVQKHFVSATNVSQFAQPKKHHE